MDMLRPFAIFCCFLAVSISNTFADDRLDESIIPILENHCFDCHAGGGEEGGVTFDHLIDDEKPGDPALWNRVIKQLRTGLMPPPEGETLEPEQVQELESWIIEDVFDHDPANPDPGRVTVRRLNRVEYRNTIRDLLGVDVDTEANFPPDDTGEGFDNLGDVLSVSPVLMEKYIDTAQSIANEVVPIVSRHTPVRHFPVSEFGVGEDCINGGNLSLPYYKPRTAKLKFEVDVPQKYSLDFVLVQAEEYIENANDKNRCRVKFFLDDELLVDEEYSRDPWKRNSFQFEREFAKGQHSIRIEIEPLTDEKRGRMLQVRFEDLMLRGPLGKAFELAPPKHAAFFKKWIPESEAGRLGYAEELIRPFLRRAFRRAADDETVERLCQLAQQVWRAEDGSFEKGIQQSMVAILASPRFVFREEFAADLESEGHGLIDEFSLASRLSYFLWSSMPDDELLDLAAEDRLRKELDSQIQRMTKDPKFTAFYQDFVGQWLQLRDVQGVTINSFSVLLREAPNAEILDKFKRLSRLQKTSNHELGPAGKKERGDLLIALRPFLRKSRDVELSAKIRLAMRLETEMLVKHIIDERRDLTELVDSDYTFLNETLANHYAIPDVKGNDMRLVKLSDDSLRGGLLGQGSMLAVTSNPDRTSPVKRGLYLLDNILGIPTGAPPPNIPSLEDSEATEKGKQISLRDALAVHRESPLCSSCHNRMDPLGLALENFDPLGRVREDREIDVSGELITGETFETLKELKKILVTNYKDEIYRCVAEKMLTYALGRSLEYYDVPTVDRVVERVGNADGSGAEMLKAVVESVAFQRKRRESKPELKEKY